MNAIATWSPGATDVTPSPTCETLGGGRTITGERPDGWSNA